ncbi:DUF6468 domain-containing protein [Aestuariispira ectoiniformans]|uniref:DUF6468 domain-containing protein n=1 Tax=Aestuariispira ectoiniformans TaxID=2775080 RepID=UPI00223B6FB5|nr:DUF6468 domain-containing protein [Aestuariispira ectoiniformans]
MAWLDIEIFVEIGFAVLLVAVLVYAIRLNRHIGALQKNKADLEKLLAGFVSSTERAEQALDRLKSGSQEKSAELDSLVGKAETLRADLAYMLDRGDEIANRLENGIRSGRSGGSPAASTVSSGDSGPSDWPELRASPDEKPEKSRQIKEKSKSDLLKALQGMR